MRLALILALGCLLAAASRYLPLKIRAGPVYNQHVNVPEFYRLEITTRHRPVKVGVARKDAQR